MTAELTKSDLKIALSKGELFTLMSSRPKAVQVAETHDSLRVRGFEVYSQEVSYKVNELSFLECVTGQETSGTQAESLYCQAQTEI